CSATAPAKSAKKSARAVRRRSFAKRCRRMQRMAPYVATPAAASWMAAAARSLPGGTAGHAGGFVFGFPGEVVRKPDSPSMEGALDRLLPQTPGRLSRARKGRSRRFSPLNVTLYAEP